MFSSWFSSWAAGPHIRLADDLEAGAVAEHKASHITVDSQLEAALEQAVVTAVGEPFVSGPAASAELPTPAARSEFVSALTLVHLPPQPYIDPSTCKPPNNPKAALLDRYAHLLDFGTAITFTPTADDGHWLLAPPGSTRYWAWTTARIGLLLAHLSVCWLALSVLELLS